MFHHLQQAVPILEMAERLAAKKDKAAHQQVLVRFAHRSNAAMMRPRFLANHV
jgi:hypothetical protein